MATQPAILYVEDDSRSRRVMQLMLVTRMKLPHVTIFEDSTDFINRAMAIDPIPDIIFLDIHVDPLDGFQMLELLRQTDHFAGSKFVALTASVMNEEVTRLRTAGFDGCLAKPIDADTFSDSLNRITQGQSIWNIFS